MNMEPTATASEKSIWGIIGDVFFSPAQAFEAFKKKPTIWVPLILVMVMAATAGFFTYEEAAQDQWQMMKTSTLPAPVLEQMRQDAQNPSPIGATIGPVIMVPLIGMLSALLAWFIGGFLFGGKAKFSEIWGAGLLAMLIPMIGGLIRIPMAIAKGTAQVSIGPAALMAQTDYVSALKLFFLFADVFAIWSLVVLAFGYSAIFGISIGKGAATSIITWVVMISLLMGMALGGLSLAGVDIRFM